MGFTVIRFSDTLSIKRIEYCFGLAAPEFVTANFVRFVAI